MKKATLRKQKKSKSFNPSRQDVTDAVKDYLENGGKITRIEPLYEDEMDWLLSRF